MQRGLVSRPTSRPAPLGGLNVRDSLAAMPTNDALTLTNWVAQQYGVRTRKGYIEWAINMTDDVKTVMSYEAARDNPGAYRLFAATDNNIYDVTSSTNVPAVSAALSGATDGGRFSFVQMANSAGTFLLAASYTGAYRYWDGAAWQVPVTIGVLNAEIVFVNTWKRRVWFIKKGTSEAYYGALDAVTGTWTKFDLGPFMLHGGKLAFIATWSIDAGEGIDDLLIFGGENGDILIYKGLDPTSATDFQKVGSWFVGRLPIGRRCFQVLGGDLLILSELGLQPLSYVTRGGQSLLRASSVDYLGKIQPKLAELMGTLQDQLGWDLMQFPRENFLLVNKPLGGFSFYQQYSLYTNTNTWSLFQNMPMLCGTVAQNNFYFGGPNGKVYKGFSGYFDNILYGATSGDGIVGQIQTAFDYFGTPGITKQFHMARPNFLAVDRPAALVQMAADFSTLLPVGSPVAGSPSGALWDTALWDSAVWGGNLLPFADWIGVQAYGKCGSCALDTVCLGDTVLVSIDYLYETGGVI